ncbi:uncharacterized protein LOC135958686 [Calliphora vicina]|uniref:uncharacterized protein LOC135958686 n=1 Tax=Calliphora vicina TaxID=7373 RepID=UPI00325B56B2
MRTSAILKLFTFFNGIFTFSALVIRFTNLECKSFDQEFVQIPQCRLKVMARDKVSLNFHLKMLQLPLINMTVLGQLLRKSNDYRPFLYNSSTNFCSFVKNANKLLFWKIVWNIARPFSNVNHTCPYNHDIIVQNMILDEHNMKLILFPPGNYLIRFYMYVQGKRKVGINTYFSIKDN